VPENVVNVDGKWSYSEYQGDGGSGVKTLDLDEVPVNPLAQ
jgi:hypothetical protein